MGSSIQVGLLVISIQIFLVAAQTDEDFAALKSLKDVWDNTPPNWVGPDPCGNGWEGIRCTNSRVTTITLASVGLTGMLSGDIGSLSELQALDLSYNKGLTGSLPNSIGSLKKLTNLILVGCSFSGPIPRTIGSLQQLSILSLNSNSFSGPIPPEIGNLSNLIWLDLTDNKLSGTIPVSDGTTPGLDLLDNTKHFHFGKNQLSGEIPSQLFSSNMRLIHVLFQANSFSGSIPSTLGLVQSLVVLDMSNNPFAESDFPPWFSTLQNLTTLKRGMDPYKGTELRTERENWDLIHRWSDFASVGLTSSDWSFQVIGAQPKTIQAQNGGRRRRKDSGVVVVTVVERRKVDAFPDFLHGFSGCCRGERRWA